MYVDRHHSEDIYSSFSPLTKDCKSLLLFKLNNIKFRQNFCLDAKKRDPLAFQQIIADMLFWYYPTDLMSTAGTGVSLSVFSDNTSKQPKIISQIAQQLLDSWDPLPDLPSNDELKKAYTPESYMKLLREMDAKKRNILEI